MAAAIMDYSVECIRRTRDFLAAVPYTSVDTVAVWADGKARICRSAPDSLAVAVYIDPLGNPDAAVNDWEAIFRFLTTEIASVGITTVRFTAWIDWPRNRVYSERQYDFFAYWERPYCFGDRNAVKCSYAANSIAYSPGQLFC